MRDRKIDFAKRGYSFDLILMYEKGWSQQQVDECPAGTYYELMAMHSLIIERQRMAAANRG